MLKRLQIKISRTAVERLLYVISKPIDTYARCDRNASQ